MEDNSNTEASAISTSINKNLENEEKKLECAICLQICIHPVRLPCRHIFCFLCVKGIANQSKKCAICRHEIPLDYLDKPEMVEQIEVENEVVFEDGYQWFYEGRNGWWQYDERTSTDLEASFKRADQRCEVLVAGFLYIIDFQQMVQMRRNDPSRRRHIKRDLANIPKKGVAGIRINSSEDSDSETVEPPNSGASCEAVCTESVLSKTPTPATPTNTPQTPYLSEDNDTSVPSSPGRNSVLSNADHSLVQALYSLQLSDLDGIQDSRMVNSNRLQTRFQPWDIDLNYEEEEEV